MLDSAQLIAFVPDIHATAKSLAVAGIEPMRHDGMEQRRQGHQHRACEVMA